MSTQNKAGETNSQNPQNEASIKSIDALIISGEATIRNHPVVLKIIGGILPKKILNVILLCFYADGLWWVAALQYMQQRARNPRFKKALLDNLNCETGANGGTPHMVLLDNFFESIGLIGNMKDPIYKNAIQRAQAENKMLKQATEQEKAGFMFGTEHLFPVLLNAIRPSIVYHYPNCNMGYIDEHIEVDADEHSIWMKESIIEMLNAKPECFEEIQYGIEQAMHGAFFPLVCAEMQINKTEKELVA
jgi:pyrroloquinoline quinone (PQQ) biosynthesis protein C